MDSLLFKEGGFAPLLDLVSKAGAAMQLNTIEFFLLFPFVLLFYWMAPPASKKYLLLAISYSMYLFTTSIQAVAIILFVTGITFLAPLAIFKYNLNKRSITISGCALSLLPLVVLKYTNFALLTTADILSAFHLSVDLPRWDILMPLGISFFTFQAISYILDVYQGKCRPERNFLDFALFVSFFPQIICGPISKSGDLLPQIRTHRKIDGSLIVKGAKKILYGLFLKLVIADRLALYVDTIFNSHDYYSGLTLFAASFCYSIQIYTDFSGYSLLAIGVANTLGFNVMENFNRPYFAHSITDFWRRWHISLSRWLRDYIYIPLGGSRTSKWRTHLNIMATFLVSGLWHGANWTFILWGGIHGAAQCLEKAFKLSETNPKGINRLLRIIITFTVINFAWIFFRMHTVNDAISVVLKILLHPTDGPFVGPNDSTMTICILIGISSIFFKDFRDEFIPKQIMLFENKRTLIRFASYLAILLSILLLGVLDGGQFIYANF